MASLNKWWNGSLDHWNAVYPIVYLVLGVNLEGHKEFPGLWLAERVWKVLA